MASVNINNWDARSRRDIGQAIQLANQFWRTIHEDKELRIDGGNPSRMILRYNGTDHEVHLARGGTLLRVARAVSGAFMLMFRCHLRLRQINNPNDHTLTYDARNSLFVHTRTRDRRTIPAITGWLIHELTHKQQEINSWLGWFSFGIAYLLTLGFLYEPEAKRLQRRARRFAQAIINAPVSVTISGPGRLYEGQQGTYVAVGAPTGGAYTFDITVHQVRDGIKGVRVASDEVTVEAVDDEGVAIINVTYVQGGNTATASVRIELSSVG